MAPSHKIRSLQETRHGSDLLPLLEEECDWQLDALPEFNSYPNLRDGFLFKVDASFIVDGARTRRDRRLRNMASVTSASAALAQGSMKNSWVVAGSDNERAWKEPEKAKPGMAGPFLNKPYTGSDPRFRGTHE